MEVEAYILINENSKQEILPEYTKKYFGSFPDGKIINFSENIIKPGELVRAFYPFQTIIIILSGGLEIDAENVLPAGEYWRLNDSEKILKNASDDYECRFLELWLNYSNPMESEFNYLEFIKPNLLSGVPYFGLYNYREDQKIDFDDPSDILVYVLSGDFEIEDRYLKTGDALILKNTQKLEFECLTEKGLFLFLKI